MKRLALTIASTATLLTAVASNARAQTAYGVDAGGQFYSFPVSTPTAVTPVGTSTGISFAGIDFNPANGQLYGLGISGSTAQLYTVNLTTGVPTTIGTGFAITPAASYGFDFNPKTVQADTSIRIRFVDSNGTNLRLNSATGAISNTDTGLTFNSATQTGISGVAYTNNFAQLAGSPGIGATTLYDVDSTGNQLFTQTNPNGGILGTPVALTLSGGGTLDVGTLAGLDNYTAPGSNADTLYLLTDASGTVPGSELYVLNPTTGVATPVGGTGLIGAGLALTDIAVQVPEPGTYALTIVGALTVLIGLQRRRLVALR